LLRDINLRRIIRHPEHAPGIFLLRKVLKKSLKNGYELGEHVIGCANFFSYDCIDRLIRSNLISRNEFYATCLAEDHLFGLLIYSIGKKNGDLATGSLPLGVRWRGLPCSPQELVLRGKKIVHSTHFYQDMTEAEIRDYFRKIRN
jgi:hypothetical protein